mmetsp:Transcript_12609/g.33756  ORF Transcript_12609/g.33756 Transcript_12609/m.33756 type:complete len:321 (-) Transcript_12609:246-1208(-)
MAVEPRSAVEAVSTYRLLVNRERRAIMPTAPTREHAMGTTGMLSKMPGGLGSSPILKRERIFSALSEWPTSSYARVASVPTTPMIESGPPGWSFMYASGILYTVPRMASHASDLLVCLATSSSVIGPSGMGAAALAPAMSFMEAGGAGDLAPAAGAAAPPLSWRAMPTPEGLRDIMTAEATRLRPDIRGEGVAIASRLARSIQPPCCLPGRVGCSKVREETTPRVYVRWIFTRKMGLLSMPITFHVRWLGCVFMCESQARQHTSLAERRRVTDTLKDQRQWHQYLPYSVGVSGCSTTPPSHVTPPSREISARITFLPPPE